MTMRLIAILCPVFLLVGPYWLIKAGIARRNVGFLVVGLLILLSLILTHLPSLNLVLGWAVE
jgi:hypothetical protein